MQDIKTKYMFESNSFNAYTVTVLTLFVSNNCMGLMANKNNVLVLVRRTELGEIGNEKEENKQSIMKLSRVEAREPRRNKQNKHAIQKRGGREIE